MGVAKGGLGHVKMRSQARVAAKHPTTNVTTNNIIT